MDFSSFFKKNKEKINIIQNLIKRLKENPHYYNYSRSYSFNYHYKNKWMRDELNEIKNSIKFLFEDDYISSFLNNSLSSFISDLEKKLSEKLESFKSIDYVSNFCWKQLNFSFNNWQYKEEFLLEGKISIDDFSKNPEKVSIPLWNVFKSIKNNKGIQFDTLIKLAKSNKPNEKATVKKHLNEHLEKVFDTNWNLKNSEIEVFKNIIPKFSISENNFEFYLKEKSKENSDFDNFSSFQDRSDGFKRMASILLSLDDNIKNRILLLDEVETHIHIDGQIKLFDFLKFFSEKNQVIFSTISPFMIKSDESINYLIFDKNEKHFSTIQSKKYLDPNGISSIYGIDIYKYFLEPKKTIIFEGGYDESFFKAILCRQDINCNDIRFLSSNGASKIKGDIRNTLETNKNIKKIFAIFDNDKEGLHAKKQIEQTSQVSTFLISEILNNENIKILEDMYPYSIIDSFLKEVNIEKKDFKSFIDIKIKLRSLYKDKNKWKKIIFNKLEKSIKEDSELLENDKKYENIRNWFKINVLND